MALIDQTTFMKNETLNATCLFFIDDVVIIVGFCLLIITCRDNVRYSKRQKIFLDLRLTPEVVGYYLTVLSDHKTLVQLEFNLKLLASAPLLDQCLLVLTKRKCCRLLKSGISFISVRHCIYRRMNSLIATVTPNNSFRVNDKVMAALMEYALENMTSFYSAVRYSFNF